MISRGRGEQVGVLHRDIGVVRPDDVRAQLTSDRIEGAHVAGVPDGVVAVQADGSASLPLYPQSGSHIARPRARLSRESFR